jgi:monofunctional biosynthetic peptidoglycan transglycosylase
MLAAVLPSPKRFRVTAASAYVRKRQQWILGQMRAIAKDPAIDALI